MEHREYFWAGGHTARDAHMRQALMAPHDIAWYYRPKCGKYRRAPLCPATKPTKG